MGEWRPSAEAEREVWRQIATDEQRRSAINDRELEYVTANINYDPDLMALDDLDGWDHVAYVEMADMGGYDFYRVRGASVAEGTCGKTMRASITTWFNNGASGKWATVGTAFYSSL